MYAIKAIPKLRISYSIVHFFFHRDGAARNCIDLEYNSWKTPPQFLHLEQEVVVLSLLVWDKSMSLMFLSFFETVGFQIHQPRDRRKLSLLWRCLCQCLCLRHLCVHLRLYLWSKQEGQWHGSFMEERMEWWLCRERLEEYRMPQFPWPARHLKFQSHCLMVFGSFHYVHCDYKYNQPLTQKKLHKRTWIWLFGWRY